MHNKLRKKMLGAVVISFLSFSIFAISTAPHATAAELKSSGSQAVAVLLPSPPINAFQQGMTQGVQDGTLQCAEGLMQPAALRSNPVPGFNEGYKQGLGDGFQKCKQAIATAPRAFQQGMTQGIQDGRLQCAEGLKQPAALRSDPASGFNEGYKQGLEAGFGQGCPTTI